jgi:hypothetical protein
LLNARAGSIRPWSHGKRKPANRQFVWRCRTSHSVDHIRDPGVIKTIADVFRKSE